jgi:hypothetical protein
MDVIQSVVTLVFAPPVTFFLVLYFIFKKITVRAPPPVFFKKNLDTWAIPDSWRGDEWITESSYKIIRFIITEILVIYLQTIKL